MKQTPQTPWTLTTAKSRALSVESQILASIPADDIAHSEQRRASPLLSCDRDDATYYLWPGRTTVTLKGNPDKLRLIEHIRDSWQERTGYSAESNTANLDGYDVEISGPDGSSYFVAFWTNDTEVKISSFSPCFALPEGNNGGDY